MNTKVNDKLLREAVRLESMVSPVVRQAIERQEKYRLATEALLPNRISNLIALQERLRSPLARATDSLRRRLEASEKWAAALEIVQSGLPSMGWYLSGEEPSHMTHIIAELITKGNYEEVDRLLLKQASDFSIDLELCLEWLREKEVPACCLQRLRVFMDARATANHEVATLVGVPLIDELSRSLYSNRDFTTKRGKGRINKPEIACVTTGNDHTIKSYHRGFIESFGLLHADVDTERLEDEDYFNRSAIVHGMMKRSYGVKDSSKVFMALMFLMLAREEEKPTSDVETLSD